MTRTVLSGGNVVNFELARLVLGRGSVADAKDFVTHLGKEVALATT